MPPAGAQFLMSSLSGALTLKPIDGNVANRQSVRVPFRWRSSSWRLGSVDAVFTPAARKYQHGAPSRRLGQSALLVGVTRSQHGKDGIYSACSYRT